MTAQRSETPAMNCLDHSGMVTRMNIGIGLLTVLCGLFAYSSFIQLPQMEARLVAQFNTLEKRVYKTESDIMMLQREDQKIISQRNLDHSNKDPLR